MAQSARSDQKLDLGTLPPNNLTQLRTSSSPSGSPAENATTALRYPLGGALANVSPSGINRTGAGSPSKDYSGSRLFPKRAREIQAQEGLAPPPAWGPPPTGSGHSTPLRETIPESPSSDTFPDFGQPSTIGQTSPSAAVQQRRTRAGTVPSRFPGPNPLGSIGTSLSSSPQTSQGLPPTAPKPDSLPSLQNDILGSNLSPTQKASLLSRLRAGSMPQRASLLSTSTPFGPSYFSSSDGWSNSALRSRASTLQSMQSTPGLGNTGSSSRDPFGDADVKTLDYLGLVDPPQTGVATNAWLPNHLVAQLGQMNRNANRFRSYSVNAKEKYADDENEDPNAYSESFGGTLSQASDISAAQQAAALQEAVRQHNAEVEAFKQLASASRPRARTAGMVEAPSRNMIRSYLPSRLDNSFSAQDLESDDLTHMDNLNDGIQQLNLRHGGMENPDEGLLESPTRALWLGNIPPSTTPSSLNVIFGAYGAIESSRVLTHKSCGFVNFESVDSAVQAKAQLHNKEIFPGSGAIRIGYAKAPSANDTSAPAEAYPPSSPDPFRPESLEATGASPAASSLRPPLNINAETAAAALKTPKLKDLRSDLKAIVIELGATPEEQTRINALIENAISYDLYHDEVPIVADPNPARLHDAPRLREIRKRIDNNSCSQAEIENIAMEMLPEIAELSSDYLGNTVVQKLFEFCSESVKEAMLAEISPHLAEIGVHKNGTWAAQKIIDVAKTPAQMELIADALRPYAVQLFLDQYGNYVIQCGLRFGAPANDFIFDCMLQKLWEVAQGRFGARAMRACLESHFATKDQQRMLASAIALHSVQLATNANGALLLTWFLDTCTFPRRRTVLAPRLIEHLVHLCTHKVAYLTVLKIINQRNEPEARDAVLNALFFSQDNNTLRDILSDQTCGSTFVFKVITTPFLEENIRPRVLENVRNVLLQLKAQPQQGYKRLMDEVGLLTRGAPGSRDQSRTRSVSRGRGPNGHLSHMSTQSPYGLAQQQQMDQMMGSAQRTASVDSSVYDPFFSGNVSYTHTPPLGSINPVQAQQLQYQQQLLAQQAAVPARQPSMYYQGAGLTMNGFGSPGPAMDPFGRPTMNGSPLQAPLGMASPAQMQAAFAPPGFGHMGAMGLGNGMYGMQYQTGAYGVQPQQQQQQMNNQRRGRPNRNGLQ